MHTIIRSSLGVLAVLLATPPLASAQTVFGIASGLDFPRAISTLYDFPHGYAPSFTIQAFGGRQLSRRLGVRFEGAVDQFSFPGGVDGINCGSYPPPPGVCCGLCPANGTEVLEVLQVSMSGVVTVTSPMSGPHVYVLAGGGPALVRRGHLYGGNVVRLSLSAGAGVAVPVRGRTRVFVEGRFEDLVNGSRYRSWAVPATVGVQF